jgi:prepilin-type N-terminal cleavage/methylation domain-containing protein/prepilin-type processing-associated H-X9-DG protein
MRKQDAFTLIELLVVIAVIALLMAILAPSLGKAREQAKKVVCTAHMKGLGTALRLYVDDNNGKTHQSPNAGLWDNAWEGSSSVTPYGPNDDKAYWGIAYHPYAQNKKIFRCPSTRRVDDWPEWGWGLAYQQYFQYCSYGINGYITWHSIQRMDDVERNVKIDQDFKHHDEVIAFQDHVEQKLDDNGDMFYLRRGDEINLTQWRNGGTLGKFPEAVQECFRHAGLSNTCWLDGHVGGIKETTGEDVPGYWYTGVRPSGT